LSFHNPIDNLWSETKNPDIGRVKPSEGIFVLVNRTFGDIKECCDIFNRHQYAYVIHVVFRDRCQHVLLFDLHVDGVKVHYQLAL
jgi:hypothetical protein